MNILKSLPGQLLIFFVALSLSFVGLLVKSFEGATLWQILFWRSLFFSLTVLTFLIITYKSKVLKSFYKINIYDIDILQFLSFSFFPQFDPQ